MLSRLDRRPRRARSLRSNGELISTALFKMVKVAETCDLYYCIYSSIFAPWENFHSYGARVPGCTGVYIAACWSSELQLVECWLKAQYVLFDWCLIIHHTLVIIRGSKFFEKHLASNFPSEAEERQDYWMTLGVKQLEIACCSWVLQKAH